MDVLFDQIRDIARQAISHPGRLLRHCSVLFMKHVLPRLCRPHLPPFDETTTVWAD